MVITQSLFGFILCSLSPPPLAGDVDVLDDHSSGTFVEVIHVFAVVVGSVLVALVSAVALTLPSS